MVRIEHVWAEGKLVLEGGELKTMNSSQIYKEAQEWRNKIIEWDTERKRANVSRVQELLKQAEGISANSEVSVITDLQQKISGVKDELFHWSFFASKEENGGAAQQLQELSAQVNTCSTNLEGLLKSP